MTRIASLDDSHAYLVSACEETFIPEANPLPITVVSMSENPKDQVVVADTSQFSPAEIAKRLRLAADVVEMKSN